MNQLILWVNMVTFALLVAASGLVYLIHLRAPKPWLRGLVEYTGSYAAWLLFGTYAYFQAVFLPDVVPTLELIFAYVRAGVSFFVLAAGSRFYFFVMRDCWGRTETVLTVAMSILIAFFMTLALGFGVTWTGPIATITFNSYLAILSGFALRAAVRSDGPKRRLIPFLSYLAGAYSLLVGIAVTLSLAPPAAYQGIPINTIATGSFMALWGFVVLLIAARWISSGSAPSEPGIPRAFSEDYGITPREAEIVVALQTGETSREIGEKLFISQRTVETHLHSIYRKCNVTNRVELIHLISRYN